MIFVDLLLIAVIVQLIHEAGFFTHLDDWFNKRFPLLHLPKIFTCSLCQTFWLCLTYILLTNNISLLALAFCLIAAHLTSVISELYYLLKGLIFKAISIASKWTE